ncbi:MULTISPECIES: phage tail protein [unclassified Clostridioides]|uniref:phage tail protein n=1 Tax=unclassified Clostridioides TaxID=2635829 RepID=UPI001D0F9E71|nr:phage tail protein [Clostridioides sp. ES-S-0001-02]MCC0657309.1 phage tail protein [Clostridioides sp. ES-S-0123-01]MCC0672714.1 phage tail protein [Clostridioides sp. ES-S-0145-01]
MANLGNMYPNLPGMLVEFKDGGSALRFGLDEYNTDSMLLLGTAVDGPVMEPVAIDDSSIELLFGSDTNLNGIPNGSTLVQSYKQARDAGCQDIRVMRISGTCATSNISAPSQVVEKNKKIDEDLSVTQGCEKTDIKLSGKGIIASSIRVYVKGKELLSGFVYNEFLKSISIEKNACDAGVPVSIAYNYRYWVEQKPEYLTLNRDKKIFLSNIPNGAAIVVTYDGKSIDEYIEMNDNVITIPSLDEGERVVVSYRVEVVGEEIETQVDGNIFMTATSNQKLLLSNTPVDGTLTLYIGGSKVLDSNSFSIDKKSKTITLKKECFQMGQVVSVSYYMPVKEKIERKIRLKSKFAGDMYNLGQVKVEDLRDTFGNYIGKYVKIIKPESKMSIGEEPLILSTLDYLTFGALVDAINNLQTTYFAETDTPEELTKDLIKSATYFIGGSNGLDMNKEDMFKALSGERDRNGYIVKQGAYQLLENYNVDWIVPLGVYADDKLFDRHQDFAYELALFCAVLSYRNKSTYGVIAMNPLKDTSLSGVQSHSKYLTQYSNEFLMKDDKGTIITDGQGNFIDLGKFISVVAGPTPIVEHKVSSLREGNPAVLYAAFNTSILPHSSPTNKILSGVKSLKYSFSNAQLNDITGNKLVSFNSKKLKGRTCLNKVFVVDAPTSAKKDSVYSKLSTLKVMRVVTDNIREVADPFIGEANTIEQRNALSATIAKRLDALLLQGVILDYSFNLIATQQDLILGQAKLEVGIVAPQELRKITTIVGLKK